jgi:histidinol-phosphate aminotransferase
VAAVIAPHHLAREVVCGLPLYKTGVSPRLLEAIASGKPFARLASNENLHGSSPRVYEAIRSVNELNLYPDGGNTAVCKALGAHLGVETDRILVSTGSENVLSAVFQCLLAPGDRFVTVRPTFLMAEIMGRASGATHVAVDYDDDLEFPVEDLVEAVRPGAKILYIANPNNPTGNAFTPNALRTIVQATPEDTLVVLDEAYYEYTEQAGSSSGSLALLDACERPYVVLRTFSKAYGLAGLRVGYGVCYHPELVTLVRRGSTIFDVGTLSQAAALAALTDQAYMQRTVRKTLEERSRVIAALDEMGVRLFPSFGNFVSLWFRKRDDALMLEDALADRSVFVKALPARPNEGLVRVTIGRGTDNDLFLSALGPSLEHLK